MIVSKLFTWLFGGVCKFCGWWVNRSETICARCTDYLNRIGGSRA